MSDMTGERHMDNKPKRENFNSDDDFGEAYGNWMARQARKPVPAAVAPKAPRPASPLASAVAPAPVKAPLQRLPARMEAERDTWNLNTKARFLRAKDKESAAKNKSS
jgi:hypothetical protein